MASIVTLGFDVADGSTWADAGLTLIEGSSAAVAKVHGGKGHAGAIAAERRYRFDGFPGFVNYGAKVTADFAGATFSGRVTGLGVNVSADAQEGYWLDLDSDINKPRVRLRRRNGGTWTTLLAWTRLTNANGGTYLVPGSSLDAGVEVYLSRRNEQGGVRLIVRVGGFTFGEVLDQDANRIEGGGSVGLLIGATSDFDDVTLDDLTVEDFAAETAAATPVTSGWCLILNGEYHDAQQMREELNVEIERVRLSWDKQPTIVLRDLNEFTSPALVVGMEVAVDYDGTRLATGVLRNSEAMGEGAEGTRYEVVSLKDLAAEVPIIDPLTKELAVTFNVPREHAQYRSDRSGKTLAQVLEWIASNRANGDGGLREVGAAPPYGDVIEAGALTGLEIKLPAVTITGDVTTAVESLMRYAPNRGWEIDRTTKAWRFPIRSTAPKRNVDLATSHAKVRLGIDTANCYTAVRFVGQARPPLKTLSLLATDPSLSLGRKYDTTLVDSWTAAKSNKQRATFVVTGNGTDGSGYLYLDVSGMNAVANEWKGGTLTVGDTVMTVRSNGATSGGITRLTLVESVWTGTGVAPSNGSAGMIDGNKHSEVFKSYTLPDGVDTSEVACLQARIINAAPDGNGFTVTRVNASLEKYLKDDGSEATAVVLASPAVKPVSPEGIGTPQNPCTEGGSEEALNVEVDLPTLDLSGSGVKEVPVLRVPAEGFRGTAYALDSAKWNGGGRPGYGDAGCVRELAIPDAEYNGGAEDAEYQTFAADILSVLGTLGRRGTIALANVIDTAWADLAQRVTVSDSGGRITGLEDSEDLWLLGVEYSPKTKTTTLYIGTLASSGGYDLGAMRKVFVENTRADELRRTQEQMLRMFECLKNALGGGGGVAAPNPNPVPECQVADSETGRPSGEAGADGNIDCPAGPGYTPACDDFPCNTVANGGQFKTNSDVYNDLTFDSIEGLADALCCALDGLAQLWATLGGVASSHDKELHKTFQDLQSIRLASEGFRDCVNLKFVALCTAITAVDSRLTCLITWINAVMIPTYSACFAARVVGPGAACSPAAPNCPAAPCVPTAACDWSFTETVCDPTDCTVTVPTASC